MMPKPDKGGKPEKPWLFRSREGKGDHVVSVTEMKDSKGKRVTTVKKTKPGNSNN
jgi:hypothetical protein